MNAPRTDIRKIEHWRHVTAHARALPTFGVVVENAAANAPAKLAESRNNNDRIQLTFESFAYRRFIFTRESRSRRHEAARSFAGAHFIVHSQARALLAGAFGESPGDVLFLGMCAGWFKYDAANASHRDAHVVFLWERRIYVCGCINLGCIAPPLRVIQISRVSTATHDILMRLSFFFLLSPPPPPLPEDNSRPTCVHNRARRRNDNIKRRKIARLKRSEREKRIYECITRPANVPLLTMNKCIFHRMQFITDYLWFRVIIRWRRRNNGVSRSIRENTRWTLRIILRAPQKTAKITFEQVRGECNLILNGIR